MCSRVGSPWWFEVPEVKNVARFQFAQRDRCMDQVALEPDLVVLKENDLLNTARGVGHRLAIFGFVCSFHYAVWQNPHDHSRQSDPHR